jgi:segregation and condensation protein B
VTDSQDDNDQEFGLDAFRAASPDDQGLSLDELSQAYADLLAGGDDPFAEASEPEGPTGVAAVVEKLADEEEEGQPEDQDAFCEISPRSILEAMLFVGHPDNEPLTSEKVASYMRGVRPQEIDELVVEINHSYDQDGSPYRIESVGAGYRMAIRDEFSSLRDRFYGRNKAAKLSQAAIDILAIVAYRQPLTRDEVDSLRAKPSGTILTQLVRRGLLRMERPTKKPRTPCYHTTDRFLELCGLESLRDLPESLD